MRIDRNKWPRFLHLIAVVLCLTSAPAVADVYVHGYTRSDGTYVAPYWRSSPDNSYNNNWSVKGNINPYTGKEGTHSPTWNDKTPYENKQEYGNPGYESSGPSDNVDNGASDNEDDGASDNEDGGDDSSGSDDGGDGE